MDRPKSGSFSGICQQNLPPTTTYRNDGFIGMNRLVYIAFIGGLLTLLGASGCNSEEISQSKAIYDNFCANCHMDDGSGLRGVIPPLANSDFLTEHREMIPCMIRYGYSDTIYVNGILYAAPMPGVKNISETEIANVMNYVHRSWGNDLPFIGIPEVQKYLKQCE